VLDARYYENGARVRVIPVITEGDTYSLREYTSILNEIVWSTTNDMIDQNRFD